MKDYSTFDILGPIMIGPSSSHTAGAAKLGKIAMEIAGDGFNKVEFYLHGSFAKTYRGHGTDKALLAGILGFEPSDERLRDSFKLAKEKNIEFDMIEADLGYCHPNTVKIVFKYKNQPDFYVIGSSIGGGNITVYEVNGDIVELTGAYPAIILKYKDQRGIISKISSTLAELEMNIATMKVTRENGIATMLCELDTQPNKKIKDAISSISEIDYVKFITR